MAFWQTGNLVAVPVARLVGVASLGSRFQEAIDGAAMRLGDTSSGDYLARWTRSEWTPAEGNITHVCDRVVADLEEQWPAERLAKYIDELAPKA